MKRLPILLTALALALTACAPSPSASPAPSDSPSVSAPADNPSVSAPADSPSVSAPADADGGPVSLGGHTLSFDRVVLGQDFQRGPMATLFVTWTNGGPDDTFLSTFSIQVTQGGAALPPVSGAGQELPACDLGAISRTVRAGQSAQVMALYQLDNLTDPVTLTLSLPTGEAVSHSFALQ